MKDNFYNPLPSTILTIFLSGVGFLLLGEGINFQETFANQNWFWIIVGFCVLILSFYFAKVALSLANKQSRLNATNATALIPDEDIAKDIAKGKLRFFTV